MKTRSLYRGHRFPAAIISQAVRWYFRFQLSLRDIEELLFERSIVVSHETIRRWCDKFGLGRVSPIASRLPGAAQDRHRSIAQLSGRQGRYSRTRKREACFRQSGCACEQPRREQSSPTRERERRMRGFRLPARTQYSCRVLARSGNTSRSSAICCVPRFIESNLRHTSMPSVCSPAWLAINSSG